MGTSEPALKDSRGKRGRAWLAVAVVTIVVLAATGAVIYIGNQYAFCGLACGPPGDVPMILNAQVTESSVATNCGIVTQGYPQAIVCQVTISAGANGTIVVNMTSQNGDSQVAFGTYSSNKYVQFASAYSCFYSSNPPDYNTLRCPISGAGSTYRFSYSISPDLPSQTDAILTIVVTKTCCWP